METFEQLLATATARGANNVPGCVLAAIDRSGQYLDSPSVAMHERVSQTAIPISFEPAVMECSTDGI